MKIYSSVLTGFVLLAHFIFLAQVSFAGNVEPEKMWRDGLEKIQGTFKYAQISSPGGLTQFSAVGNKIQGEPASINQLPDALKAQLLGAFIRIEGIKLPTQKAASQDPSPGPRGQAPYHGHLRAYDEYANGTVTFHGIPGVGLVEGDTGNGQGRVEFHIMARVHSDPSDGGMMLERRQGESTWGNASEIRTYAALDAVRLDSSGKPDLDNPASQLLANARLMRGGQDIIVMIDWDLPKPPAGVTRQWYVGSIRLAKTE